MGSNRTTIGNAGGINLFTFTAAGQDSGPLLYSVSAAGNKPHNLSLVRGCTEFTFGLTGAGTGLLITLYFTTDLATAAGTSANPVWFLAPAPSTEASAQWSNPMTNVVGSNACHFKANAIAFRATSEVDPSGAPLAGSTGLQMLAGF
jgi:hypothetical protein